MTLVCSSKQQSLSGAVPGSNGRGRRSWLRRNSKLRLLAYQACGMAFCMLLSCTFRSNSGHQLVEAFTPPSSPLVGSSSASSSGSASSSTQQHAQATVGANAHLPPSLVPAGDPVGPSAAVVAPPEELAGAVDGGALSVEPPPQVEAWRQFWKIGSLKRMRSPADAAHIHAMTGGIYLLAGFLYLTNIFIASFVALNGGIWESAFPQELLLASIGCGVMNSLSGLQPGLLANRGQDLASSLGLGPDANLKSGGFINATVFHLVLTYQGLRVLPMFFAPVVTLVLDPVVAAVSLLATIHTAVLLQGWVSRGSMHLVDTLLLPPLMNLPASLHLAFYGQQWLDEMAAQHQGWEALFFDANFLLAWALAAVTFILSLYERRVISLGLRGVLLLALPMWAFWGVGLLAAEHTPEFFGNSFGTMLTLIPGSSTIS
mmetsp:Transcript_52399/g.125166  ORF Transcript_52399/g.125166 Transcript_52399/m.125166 type:complete len:430 (-) Transcript_52399:161-1450(-)